MTTKQTSCQTKRAGAQGGARGVGDAYLARIGAVGLRRRRCHVGALRQEISALWLIRIASTLFATLHILPT